MNNELEGSKSDMKKYILLLIPLILFGIWNVQPGKSIRTMKGHEAHIRSIDISPDGKFILTASGNDSIRLWEFASGIELCKLIGHLADVSEAVFHPINNKIVVSASNDKTIRTWYVGTE